jgi:hypothetical protein
VHRVDEVLSHPRLHAFTSRCRRLLRGRRSARRWLTSTPSRPTR